MSSPRRPTAAHLPGLFQTLILRFILRRDPAEYATPFPRLGFFKRQLIRLSGVDPALFENYDVGVHVRGEYASMGGSVLIPTTFAFVCATLTLKAVLGDSPGSAGAARSEWMFLGDHTWTCVISGLVWAMMIMRMDISIMATMHKWVPSLPDPESWGGGRPPRMIWRTLSYFFHHIFELWVPLLRLTAAGVLGVVMSHCLVLLAFHVEIDNHIDQARQKQIEQLETTGATFRRAMENEIAGLRQKANNETQVTLNLGEGVAAGVLPPSAARNTKDDDLLQADPQGRELLRLQKENDEKLALATPRLKDLPDLIKKKEDEADLERKEGNKSVGRGAGEGERYRQRKKEEEELKVEYQRLLTQKPILDSQRVKITNDINKRVGEIVADLNEQERANRAAVRRRQEDMDARLRGDVDKVKKTNLSNIGASLADAEKRRIQYEETVNAEISRIKTLRDTKRYGILERSIHLHQMMSPPREVPLAPADVVDRVSPSTPAKAPVVETIVPAGALPATLSTAQPATFSAGPGSASASAPALLSAPAASATDMPVASTLPGTLAAAPPGAAGSGVPMSSLLASTDAPLLEKAQDTLSGLVASFKAGEAAEQGKMLWMIWAFTLAAFLILDITPVLLKLLRRVSTVDILLQRLMEDAMKRTLDDFRTPPQFYDPDEDHWNQSLPESQRPKPRRDDDDDPWAS